MHPHSYRNKKLNVMKKIFFFLLVVSIVSCTNTPADSGIKNESPSVQQQIDSTDLTNNFFDNEEVHPLKFGEIEIAGEVNNPGMVDFKSLPLRTIIVKEALPTENGNEFVGAFRYDGYSLFDILNLHTPNKNNQEAFPPIIDLYAEIENANGEKVIFSWGEIYYPTHLNEIIIATNVMRIVPSKTKELWPLPTNSKIVVGQDLLTSRNIDSPVKITIKTASREFEIEKGMSPMFAPKVDVFVDEVNTLTINKTLETIQTTDYESIFYGRGRGIHSTTPFHGQMMKNILQNQIPFTAKNLQQAYIIISAEDGYRGVFTYSEIFNRNDQAELLLIYDPQQSNGGAFRLFPASDFFSDRAIKSVNGIYFEMLN